MEVLGVTELLRRASQGDKVAEAELLPQVYRELHSIALNHLRRERPGHTLQATALVNEAYMKLSAQANSDWKSRAHFFAFAAQSMRRILVDYARQRGAAKRGDGAIHEPLEEGIMVSNQPMSAQQSELIINMDEALTRLEKINPRQAKVVELRFFTGLTEEEIGVALGISTRTVKREWTMARAWLYGELSC
jgi:RNA polymerase sigma factor (TIGR02999 family)